MAITKDTMQEKLPWAFLSLDSLSLLIAWQTLTPGEADSMGKKTTNNKDCYLLQDKTD